MKKLTAWALALTASALIVKGTSIGPVILVVSESRGWGVHTGDSLILIPLGLAALYTMMKKNKA